MDEITFKEFEWDPKDNEKFIPDIKKKINKATFEPPKESRIIYTDRGSRILNLLFSSAASLMILAHSTMNILL